MEYNQYWNEIKSFDDDTDKRVENTNEESIVSFSYNAVPQEPAEQKEETEVKAESGSFFEEDEFETSEENADDDSTMYANSSLFDLIDEMEEKEDAEKEEKLRDARFINFDFKDDIELDSEKDVHIFADDSDSEEDIDDIEIVESVMPADEFTTEELQESEQTAEEVPEEVAEQEEQEEQVKEQVEEPSEEPEVVAEAETVEGTYVEPEPAESPVEEMPHFESPVFDDKEETDIDQLILEARKKEHEETSQQKLMADSDLLPLLKDIISFMPASCGFVDYILQLSNDDRKDLVRFIDQAKNAWLKDNSDKLFTIAEGDLSICILSDITDPMREVQRLETIGAQMFSYEKDSWNVVKLYFDKEGKLLRAATSLVNKDSFNSWQWKIVQNSGYNLWKARQK